MPRPRRPSLFLLITAALALPTLASLRYAFVLSPSPSIRLGLISAGLWLQLPDRPAPPSFTPFPTVPMRPPPNLAHRNLYAYRHGFSTQWWFEHNTVVCESWSIPLWPPFAAVAAFYAWRITRRRFARQPWQCKPCGYDLRGLTSPVCPECGNAAHPTEPRP